MRAMPRSLAQTCVALTLLALFAAPVARAAVELGAGVHSCCPERQAPPRASEEPCQQIAPTSCCLEVGVPPTPNGDAALAAPVLVLVALSSPVPATPALFLRAALTQADGPPLPPLAMSGVLLL